MKSISVKFIPILFCILILVACDYPLSKDAPYQLINAQKSTMVYGVYPQADGTYHAITNASNFGEFDSDTAIYRFDRELTLVGKTAIPTDSLTILKQTVESDNGYWLTIQIYLNANKYRYELLHIDRAGNELYRKEFAISDGMLGTDLYMLDEMGTLVVFNPEDVAIYMFGNDGLSDDPWIIEKTFDRIIPSTDNPGTLLGATYSGDELTVTALDVANRNEVPQQTIAGFDPELDFDDFHVGKQTLVVLRNPSDTGPIPPDNVLYHVDGDAAPIRILFKGYVANFLDYNGSTLILGVQRSEDKPKLTSQISIYEVKDDGSLEVLDSFDPMNLLIPQAIVDGNTVIMYGHVGHPIFGLTGFVKKIDLKK